MIDKTILARRSIRKFNDKKVANNSIIEVIDIAKFAPSGKNRQPWKVKILSETEKIDILGLLNKKTTELKELGSLPSTIDAMAISSHILLIFNPYSYTEKPYSKKNMLMDIQSVGAFIQNMLLLFTERDICSLWINETYHAKEEIEQYLKIDTNELIAAIAIGYNDEQLTTSPRHSIKDILI